MTERQKAQLAETIAGGLVQAERSVQERMLNYFNRADAGYGQRVSTAIEDLN